MLHTLSPVSLTVSIDPSSLGFEITHELADNLDEFGWVGQSQAEVAATFGLSAQAPGFHLLVLGDPGSGRTYLLNQAMHQASANMPIPPDTLLLGNLEIPDKPLFIHLPAGSGFKLKQALDQLIRQFAKALPVLLMQERNSPSQPDKAPLGVVEEVQSVLDQELQVLRNTVLGEVTGNTQLNAFLSALKQDVLNNLEIFLSPQNPDNEGLLEGFLHRYRANLLVDNRALSTAPVVYDSDPTFQSLFGGIESAGESSTIPDFLRLRAGNLLRAHGGFLMLHLRDIASDQQNSSLILEKLYRFLRNGYVQIEDQGGSGGQGGGGHFTPLPLPANVKVVLIATPEEYYALHDEIPEFARYFPIKVDFVDSVEVNSRTYQQLAQWVSAKCKERFIPPFTATAVASLLQALHRKVDDQSRVSTNFAYLETLMLEASTYASMRKAGLVDEEDIHTALQARLARHEIPEQQLRASIVEGELMLRLQGEVIGQINGLSHIDLGDASFGSPIRISARCFAGKEGVINIDREVKMSGPNHDKGILILQSWLAASFPQLAPLSLSASLVFEQEYHGVEGDSASCAELYALLSALSELPIAQGIAVTGAMNQHGEVTAIGGVNEKIEGYFRVCQHVGLNGKQGVIIPKANMRHLVLNRDVINAVAAGQFHLYAIEHVLDGIALLTGALSGKPDQANYDNETDSVMGKVQKKLESFRDSFRRNKP